MLDLFLASVRAIIQRHPVACCASATRSCNYTLQNKYHDTFPRPKGRAAPVVRETGIALKNQERESSESPMLKAFCRVAPSDRRSFLAILPAGVFLRAIAFRSRTSPAVHARRFFARLAIKPPFTTKTACIPYGNERKVSRQDGDHLDSDHVV